MNNVRQLVSLVVGCIFALSTIRLIVGLIPQFRPRLRVEGSKMSVGTVATGIATFGLVSAVALSRTFGTHFPKTLAIVAAGGLILFCAFAVRDQYGGSAKDDLTNR